MKLSSEQFTNELKSFLEKTGLDVKTLLELLSTEIPEPLRSQISNDKSFYSLAGGRDLKFIQPKINLRKFYDYIKSSANYKGFRLYPALIKPFLGIGDHTFFSMLAHSVDEDDQNEISNYYLFKKEDYSDLDPGDAVLYQEAKVFLQDYYQTILIDSKSQMGNPKSKKSRYYSFIELDSYLQRLPVSADFNDYYVKIEIGYITGIISKDHLLVYYRTQFPDPSDIYYHEGFTCMLRIYDYGTNTPLATTLEVGHPCPPQCGSLTW